MRRFGLCTIFGNPGSTEVPFLVGLPPDIHFVLGLHEGSVVGMATGWALSRERPALVNLHTAPGLGNAINAIANARDCRAPLIVLVGQQDRRQLAYEPFLTGRALERLAGDYPVWSSLPARAQDVPGAIARAYNEALAQRGPALVVVPMGDWDEPADPQAAGWPDRVVRARGGVRGGRERARGDDRRRALAGARGRPGRGQLARDGRRSRRSPSGSHARSGRSRSRAARAFRRTTRCSPAICRGGAS